jgi:hypothetical protein
MRIFRKKFKVRVVYFGDNYYVIQYAYYRFIPIYSNIEKYVTMFKSWNSVLLPCKDAEEFAEKFNSIEDIKKYYKKYYLEESSVNKSQKIYLEKVKPYESKQII